MSADSKLKQRFEMLKEMGVHNWQWIGVVMALLEIADAIRNKE